MTAVNKSCLLIMLINRVTLSVRPAVLTYVTVLAVRRTRGRRGAGWKKLRGARGMQTVSSLLAGAAAIAIFFRGRRGRPSGRRSVFSRGWPHGHRRDAEATPAASQVALTGMRAARCRDLLTGMRSARLCMTSAVP